jgi:hypothetical protein
MPTMPYWMNKTPEMVAMDRWFSGPDLVTRYTNAINRVLASQLSNALPATSDVLDNELAGEQTGAFAHFGSDWLNPTNPSSGGSYWPHVPTFTIISWFQIGVLHAARKGLGWTELMSRGDNPAHIFEPETKWGGMAESELDGVLPLVTTWVCSSPAGTGTVEVDAVRGPTAVEMIIATPQPKSMQSRINAEVQAVIDEQWIILHGGSGANDLVNNDGYEPPSEPES